jgi:hypothetical protein
MHRTAIAALCATLCAVAVPAAAQKDVGEPLEHFLATKTVDGQLRSLDDPVARVRFQRRRRSTSRSAGAIR